MCPAHDTITSKDLYRYAAGVLQPHLQWRDRGQSARSQRCCR